MLKKIKDIPKPIIFGQTVFLISILIFILTLLNGDLLLANYTAYGVVAGGAVGVLTSLIPSNSDWKYAMFDIAVTSFLFIAYVEVFS